MDSTKCQNLTIFKKSTKVYKLTFKKDGTVTDITGSTVYMTVKKNVEDSDAEAIINKTVTSHSDAARANSNRIRNYRY